MWLDKNLSSYSGGSYFFIDFCVFFHLRRILSSFREGLTARRRFTLPCLTLWVEMMLMLSWRRPQPGSTLYSTPPHPQDTMCSLAHWKMLQGKGWKVIQHKSVFRFHYKNVAYISYVSIHLFLCAFLEYCIK